MLEMDAYDPCFWAAIHNIDPRDGPCLGHIQRERAKVFIRNVHDRFPGILDPGSGAS